MQTTLTTRAHQLVDGAPFVAILLANDVNDANAHGSFGLLIVQDVTHDLIDLLRSAQHDCVAQDRHSTR